MKWQITALKVLLIMICVVNLTLGVLAFISKPLILKAIDMIYSVQLTDIAEHTHYIIKMMGCFLIAISVMAGLAARDPLNNKIVIYGNSIWLALRGIQRITYVERFHQDWGIPYANLWFQVVLVFAYAIALYLLIPKKSEA